MTRTATRRRGPNNRTRDVPIYSLGLHADYGCGRSGVCCSSKWNISVEAPAYERISKAFDDGRLTTEHSGGRPLEAIFKTKVSHLGDRLRIIDSSSGSCAFHSGSSCRVHDTLGAEVLPDICRVFPRVVVQQPRGTFISLSHFCPTAAEMLFRQDIEHDVAMRPMSKPPAFPATAKLSGLDARTHIPPLVAPNLPMSWTLFEVWENHGTAFLSQTGHAPRAGLAAWALVAERVRKKVVQGARPEDVVRPAVARSLREGVDGVLADGPEPRGGFETTVFVLRSLFELLREDVEFLAEPRKAFAARYGREADEPEARARYRGDVEALQGWDDFQEPLRRYLTARHFANWYAYQGYGVRTEAFSLACAYHLVRTFAMLRAGEGGALSRDDMKWAFRASDYFLLHALSRQALAGHLSRIEAADEHDVFHMVFDG